MLIVPSLVGMNATSDPPDDFDHAERHLSECIITFERNDAPKDSLVSDYAEEVRSGHLPRGLFNQLCAAALGWSLQTAPTNVPSLSSHSAKMHFGRHPVALLQRTGEQAVRLQLKKPGVSAVALRLRLQLLLDEVLRRRFPTIRARFRLHQPTSEGSLIEVKMLEEYGTEDVLEIKQQLSQWFPPETPPREYDVFVSYRQKQGDVFTFDSRFADMLADCLAAREKVVFLDKRWPSLQEGQALDTAFLLSMVNSKVVVPLISWSALRRMTALSEESEVDYVLLEWTMAVLLQELGVKVFPIFIGADSDENLFESRPPRASADGKRDATDTSGMPVPDPRSVFERMPKTVVASVVKRLETFFSKYSQTATPAAVHSLTVHEVVAKLKSCDGAQLWNLSTSHAGKQSVVHELAEHWGKEEATAERLCKVLQTAKGCRVRFAETVATSSRSLEQTLHALEKTLLSKMDAIHTEVKTLGHHLSGQLDFLIQGDTECPWLFVLWPQEPTLQSRWDPRNLLNSTQELRFLCAHNGRPVEPPLLIKEPKEWVKKAGPAVRFGLQAVKLGLLVGRVTTGLKVDEFLLSPVSDGLDRLADFKDKLDSMLHVIRDEEKDDPQASDALDELEKKIDGAMAEEADAAGLQQAAEKAKRLAGPAFRALANLVMEQKYLEQLPMRKVSARGEVAWVHLDNVDAWLQARGGEGQPLPASSPKGSSHSAAAPTASRAPLQRMGTSSLGDVTKVTDLICSALPEVGPEIQTGYVKQLLEDGFSNVDSIATIADNEWPAAIRRGHRKRIREAAAALAKGSCCRCVQ